MSARSRLGTAAMVAAALTAGYLAQGTYAAGVPANKVAAAGSEAVDVPFGTATPILSQTVKINNPTDLILGVSLECALTTQVISGADDTNERAFGEIKIYVTIDGKYVPISDEDTDRGRVVFCSRAQEQQWTDTDSPPNGPDDEQDQLRQRLDTRDANAFNWMALNVGTNYPGTDDNVHKIQVWAEWTKSATVDGEATTTNAMADATIGNRTLILEPVKAAHDATVPALG